MLSTQLSESISQLALILLLATAVDLHHARLVATLGLTQLLWIGEKGKAVPYIRVEKYHKTSFLRLATLFLGVL